MCKVRGAQRIPWRLTNGCFKYNSEAQESLYRFYIPLISQSVALATTAGPKNIPPPRDKLTRQFNICNYL